MLGNRFFMLYADNAPHGVAHRTRGEFAARPAVRARRGGANDGVGGAIPDPQRATAALGARSVRARCASMLRR